MTTVCCVAGSEMAAHRVETTHGATGDVISSSSGISHRVKGCLSVCKASYLVHVALAAVAVEAVDGRLAV